MCRILLWTRFLNTSKKGGEAPSSGSNGGGYGGNPGGDPDPGNNNPRGFGGNSVNSKAKNEKKKEKSRTAEKEKYEERKKNNPTEYQEHLKKKREETRKRMEKIAHDDPVKKVIILDRMKTWYSIKNNNPPIGHPGDIFENSKVIARPVVPSYDPTNGPVSSYWYEQK